jgi:hypothetical protein
VGRAVFRVWWFTLADLVPFIRSSFRLYVALLLSAALAVAAQEVVAVADDDGR